MSVRSFVCVRYRTHICLSRRASSPTGQLSHLLVLDFECRIFVQLVKNCSAVQRWNARVRPVRRRSAAIVSISALPCRNWTIKCTKCVTPVIIASVTSWSCPNHRKVSCSESNRIRCRTFGEKRRRPIQRRRRWKTGWSNFERIFLLPPPRIRPSRCQRADRRQQLMIFFNNSMRN